MVIKNITIRDQNNPFVSNLRYDGAPSVWQSALIVNCGGARYELCMFDFDVVSTVWGFGIFLFKHFPLSVTFWFMVTFTVETAIRPFQFGTVFFRVASKGKILRDRVPFCTVSWLIILKRSIWRFSKRERSNGGFFVYH